MDSKKKKLLDKTYQDYIDLMLYDFPIEKITDIVAEDVKGYGSTLDEKFRDIDRLRKMVLDQREQGKGIKMNFEHTPIHKRISPENDNAVYTDEFEISMEIDGSKNLIPLRLTSVFEFKDQKWKLVHIHGSMGVETEEHDTWHQDEWKKKNQELQKLVNEKTAELRKQNRELEIQAALDRIRSRTSAMQDSAELNEVVAAVYTELAQLGIDVHLSLILIYDWKTKQMEWWSSGQGIDVMPQRYNVQVSPEIENHPWFIRYFNAQKNKVDFEFYKLEGDEKRTIDKYLFEQTDLKTLPEDFRKTMSGIESVMLAEAFMKRGVLSISVFEELPEESISLIKRFARVIDETFNRVEELRIAEAQARESQIEAALERVRARTMAMQKSEELAEAASEMFKQIELLGLQPWSCGFNIFDHEKKTITQWVSSGDGRILSPFETPANEDIFVRFYEASKRGESLYVEEMGGEQLVEHYKYMTSIPAVGAIVDELDQAGIELPKYQVNHAAFYKQGYLMFITYEQVPEFHTIFKRFAKVFEQTYTRFLDLQNAEKQARETEIQLALERMRARSMAMRSSQELADLSFELVKQVLTLGIKTWFCAFNIWDDHPDGSLEWGSNARGTYEAYRTPREGIFLKYYEAGQQGETLLINEIDEKECPAHYEYLCSLPGVGEQLLAMKDAGIFFPTSQIDHVAYFKYGYIIFITFEPVPEAHNTFKRFAKEFEQTYTRFLDLQKVEKQAREAEIQLALERVRARTMAMQKSEELADTAVVISDQLKKLRLLPENARVFFSLIDSKYDTAEVWMTRTDGTFRAGSHKIPLKKDKELARLYREWKKNAPLIIRDLKGKKLQDYYDFLKTLPHVKEEEGFRKILDNPPKHFVLTEATYKYGTLGITSSDILSIDTQNILVRFAKVFEQTYTRFLDLQKAETQAREAQIETSLERVRAKAMAMRNSSDIPGAVAIVFKELSRLGIEMERNGILLFSDETPVTEVWSTPLSPQDKMEVEIVAGTLDTRIHPLLQGVYNTWKAGKKHFSYELIGEEVQKYYELLKKQPNYRFPTIEKYSDFQVANGFLFKEGQIFAFTKRHLTDEEKQIFYRFTYVFSHTYRRYVDIVKAEKQAREAEIEMSLERIRAKAMAMRNSSDIPDAVAIVFNELARLGIYMERCGIVIFNNPPVGELWSTPLSPENKQVIEVVAGKLNFEIHPMLAGALESWKRKKDYYSYALKGEEVPEYYELLEKVPDYRFPLVENYPDSQILNTFNFNEGLLFAYSVEALAKENLNIFLRFTRVFSLTFRRYQDLINAEEQAREAQIEAALERIRSRTMAMQKSEELQEVVTTVAERLHDLGIVVDAGGVIICTYFQNSKDVRHWISAPDFSYSGSYLLPYFNHVIFNDAWNSRLSGDDFFTKAYSVEEKDSFFEYAFENSDYRHFPAEFKEWMFAQKQHTLTFAWSKNSALLIPSHTGYVPSENEKEILKRFAQVFEQAYIRFLDIQKAEIQAKEVRKQASLDRVRGEIASMRTSEDLNRITPVIWRELKALEVPFFRCGVFIVNEAEKNVEVYLSTPEGKAIAALNLVFDSNELTKNTVEHWRKKRIFRTHWDKQDFINWTRSMMDIGQVKSAESYQGSASVPESLNLHFVPFKQGMLYVGDVNPLTNEKIDLIKTLAEAFSIAYARYEDFKNLEEAKNKIEITLSELKAAQNQLIQSEKMASLGELTAGIAHEIQNPLNFVNNFSEISHELLEELQEEIENGNNEEVKSIASDVIQNLRKINHHGKRAEAIIKGMLLHSRGSSGHKESTDINALADEYLRLSFHGFRAKDKSFNADYKLEIDDSVPKLNVVPQDIGRVLLNLINNAFYVVNEKAKQNIKGYKPEVVVKTQHKLPFGGMGGLVEITVSDNGPGIPDKVKDKIFQPFFTTKPTGSGTGLGLSLSYDIVKAHGGKISVDTSEKKGTEFTIEIPLN